jgi:hypothetical protein
MVPFYFYCVDGALHADLASAGRALGAGASPEALLPLLPYWTCRDRAHPPAGWLEVDPVLRIARLHGRRERLPVLLADGLPLGVEALKALDHVRPEDIGSLGARAVRADLAPVVSGDTVLYAGADRRVHLHDAARGEQRDVGAVGADPGRRGLFLETDGARPGTAAYVAEDPAGTVWRGFAVAADGQVRDLGRTACQPWKELVAVDPEGNQVCLTERGDGTLELHRLGADGTRVRLEDEFRADPGRGRR